MSPKGPPFNFFLFCKRMDVRKLPRAPLFHFSALCNLPETKKFRSFSSIFRSRKNFRLLMQSCCFFFSRPFHENFKFLENCPYDFYKILNSHSTPEEAPACAMASKSYGWHVRNIAKFSPKNSHFSTFFDFLKNCPYDSNRIFYSCSTPY